MRKILVRIGRFALISVIIYFAIAGVLIVVGTSEVSAGEGEGLAFDELTGDYASAPELMPYTTRNGTDLHYRYYPAQDSSLVLLLLHGSGWHSQYFLPLAQQLSEENVAHVYTPDLRGHGPHTEQRGDVDYIGQMEDDLADLIDVIRAAHPDARLILGGHSSGGGLVVRFGGSRYGQGVDAYLLLAPFLQYNAPTVRPNSGGWAYPYTGRIIGLTMLNTVGITWFNHLTAIEYNMPAEVRDGTETLAYSFRLNTAYAPSNYIADLQAMTQPLLLLVGSDDEAFFAEEYDPIIREHTENGRVQLLPGLGHMGVVTSDEVLQPITEWLQGL